MVAMWLASQPTVPDFAGVFHFLVEFQEHGLSNLHVRLLPICAFRATAS